MTRTDAGPCYGPDCDHVSHQPKAPEPAERGRYAIFEQADGSLVIPRSSPLCEACAGCTCGEQQEPIRIPAALVRMARAAAEGKADGMAGKLKAMIKL